MTKVQIPLGGSSECLAVKKLGIGTVQFGLDYGITNTQGITPQAEVKKIIDLALEHEINLLDTASGYGCSEAAIGSCYPNESRLKIVTKTPTFNNITIPTKDCLSLKETFEQSLDRLARSTLYGLLVHNSDDLFAQGGELLFEQMIALKLSGQVQKIGVSVYTKEQIDKILERYPIDLIQIPINVLDQRLLSGGQLKQLKAKGIEIHARSIFLQGLLLTLPEDINPYFEEILSQLVDYHCFLQQNQLTPLQGALHFAAQISEIDLLVVGVCHSTQLLEIINATAKLPAQTLDFSPFSCSRERYINPALWPDFVTR